MDRLKKAVRIAILSVVTVASIALLLLLFHQAFLPLLAWFIPYLEGPFYDYAVYGAYPTQGYQSFDLRSPAVSVLKWDDSCDQGLVLLSPNGPSVADPGPMILDSAGNLVWMSKEYGTAFNLRVQRYHEEDYLTFWAGRKSGTMGAGSYFMLDSTYKLVKKVDAVGEGYDGDLHEFIITDQGTALMTVYNTTQADLSAFGRPTDGWITDSLFQEVDIETGELIFQWRASDHFSPTDSFYKNPFGGYHESNPYDFFHINSIQKDSQGNYLICSRHLHIIASISPSGETLWVLGGADSDFEDLSNGLASDFKWQHDARWVDENQGIISVFDNGGAGPIMSDADYSKGTTVQLDRENMTATLLHSYVSLQKTLSASQGSVQILPENNHVLVGWGSAGAFSEYTPDGELLCETHFGASSLFWWERVKSYRALKFWNWKGIPYYAPHLRVAGGSLYVSWNGATEVFSWQLEGSSEDVQSRNEAGQNGDQPFETIDIIPKQDFEDSFILSSSSENSYQRYRIAAIDRDGNTLRYSDIIDVNDASTSNKTGGHTTHTLFIAFLAVCGCMGLGVGVWLFVTKVLRKRKSALYFSLPTTWEMMPSYRYQKL